MKSSAEHFFKDCKGKKIAVVGMGISNLPLIRMLSENGACVTACDKREAGKLINQMKNLSGLDITYCLGSSYLDVLEGGGFELVFKTPGMRYDTPELVKARENGARITSEMELFLSLCPCKVIAVTGSDGKTTTTTLISELLKEEGYTVYVGGNIGAPLLEHVGHMKEGDFAVLELSSFQLMRMRISPNIAVVTNLAPNHLDMHKDLSEYIDAKRNIYLHQSAFDTLVVNWDNETTRFFGEDADSFVRPFGREKSAYQCIYLDKETIMEKNGKACEKVLDVKDIRLPGTHNVENYMAAIAATREFVSNETVKKIASRFGGVPHRIEFVRQVDGVRYYNDSIASSPTRTLACLNAFDEKLIIIAGGYDKQIPFEPMAKRVNEKVKTLILTGPTAKKIEDAVKGAENYDGQIEICHAENLAQAVSFAHDTAKKGDVVALSPACASFDAFANFEERGNFFKDLVNSL